MEKNHSWPEVKEKIMAMWRKISDKELEATKGNLSEISGLILHKYKDPKADVVRNLIEIVHSVKNNEDL